MHYIPQCCRIFDLRQLDDLDIQRENIFVDFNFLGLKEIHFNGLAFFNWINIRKIAQIGGFGDIKLLKY